MNMNQFGATNKRQNGAKNVGEMVVNCLVCDPSILSPTLTLASPLGAPLHFHRAVQTAATLLKIHVSGESLLGNWPSPTIMLGVNRFQAWLKKRNQTNGGIGHSLLAPNGA